MNTTRILLLSTACLLLLTTSAKANHHEQDATAQKRFTKTQQPLVDLLTTFLHGASYGKRQAHDRFWHDDLIYTSSNGTRTDKAQILSGISEDPSTPAEEPPTLFSADDIQVVMLSKSAAVIAFKLVAAPNDAAKTPSPATNYYFNTGTFVKERGEWRAIAWQATTKAKGTTE
ncbi:MAG: nuclear transport factor 2 family protein [Pseudomonadota bacterium]